MKKKKTYIIRIALIIMTLAVACAIFALSADSADESNARSDPISASVVYKILSLFDLSDAQTEKIVSAASLAVRKAAHFSEYALLGFLLAGVCESFYKSGKFTFFISWAAGSLYAVSDEIHQRFVPGRSCQAGDMLLDSCGAAAGAAVSLLVYFIIKKIKASKRRKKEEKR